MYTNNKHCEGREPGKSVLVFSALFKDECRSRSSLCTTRDVPGIKFVFACGSVQQPLLCPSNTCSRLLRILLFLKTPRLATVCSAFLFVSVASCSWFKPAAFEPYVSCCCYTGREVCVTNFFRTTVEARVFCRAWKLGFVKNISSFSSTRALVSSYRVSLVNAPYFSLFSSLAEYLRPIFRDSLQTFHLGQAMVKSIDGMLPYSLSNPFLFFCL